MNDKITASKVGKQYMSPQDRPKVNSSLSHALKEIIPTIHRNVNTPTAAQLMKPEVGIGEGNIRDKAPYMTVDDLPDDWLEKMKEAAVQGKGPTGFMVALNITKAGLETLRATSPEFEEAFQYCLLLSCAWWEDRGRDMVTGAKGNSAVWLANMINRWNWESSKSVQSSTVNSNIQSTIKATISPELTEAQIDEKLKERGLDKLISMDLGDMPNEF